MKPTKRQKKGVYHRVLVLKVDKTDYHIVYDYQDGTACMASTDCPDGHLRTEYCQERFTKDFGDLAEELAEGELYMNDWDGSEEEFPHKTEVDEEVIQDAIGWLCTDSQVRNVPIKKTKNWETAQKEIRKFLRKA